MLEYFRIFKPLAVFSYVEGRTELRSLKLYILKCLSRASLKQTAQQVLFIPVVNILTSHFTRILWSSLALIYVIYLGKLTINLQNFKKSLKGIKNMDFSIYFGSLLVDIFISEQDD